MNEEALHMFKMPVLELMILDLEFHRAEYARDGATTVIVDKWIRQCKNVLEAKRNG